MTRPAPQEWSRAYARVQVVADQQIVGVLADATDSLRVDMARIASRRSAGDSESIRYHQMATVRRALLEGQSSALRRLGRVVEARRLEATARAIQLGNAMDAFVLEGLGHGALAHEVLNNLKFGLARTTQVALARMGYSYTALAQHIYNNDVWLGSRIDQRITSLLAQGLTARDFAAEAIDWFNPNTPGGVRYAAMRLARSEINNAYHAVSVQQAQDKPWVNGMQWNLSSSHPKADLCDEYAHEDHSDLGAGVFKKQDVPRKPHPHCFCYVTPVQVDPDAFLNNLVNGNYDRWMAEQRTMASQQPPDVPNLRSVASRTRARTAPPANSKQPTQATKPIALNGGELTKSQIDNAKRMYGDFTRNVQLLDAIRVTDLRAIARTYGLIGASGQSRPVLLRRLKAKLSRRV